jgi:hypothetical protein
VPFGDIVKLIVRFAVLAACLALLSGCGLFDSKVMWRGGPYILLWIDTLDNSQLNYDLGEGTSIGRIDKTVYAVGWNGRYLVAKQHPSGDKATTNFYIIDSLTDSRMAEPTTVVIGPLTQEQFQAKTMELQLPGFSKTIGALE